MREVQHDYLKPSHQNLRYFLAFVWQFFLNVQKRWKQFTFCLSFLSRNITEIQLKQWICCTLGLRNMSGWVWVFCFTNCKSLVAFCSMISSTEQCGGKSRGKGGCVFKNVSVCDCKREPQSCSTVRPCLAIRQLTDGRDSWDASLNVACWFEVAL